MKFGRKAEAVAGRRTPNSSGRSFTGEEISSDSARRCRDLPVSEALKVARRGGAVVGTAGALVFGAPFARFERRVGSRLLVERELNEMGFVRWALDSRVRRT